LINVKESKNLIPVILCGGFGTRLWPLSRKSFPKQFVKILGKQSLLQQTVNHFLLLNNKLKIPEFIFVTNDEHRFILESQIKELKLKNYQIILEPSSKNTAPSATLAAIYINKKYKNFNMLILPSDHLITNSKKFIELIEKSLIFLNKHLFILFGIVPKEPTTHFGYIEFDNNKKLFPKNIIKFIEKPNIFKARRLLQRKNLLWNSGMFLLEVNTWLDAIKLFDNKMFNFLKLSMDEYDTDNQFIRPKKDFFNKISSNSIDYAVIEKLTQSDFNLKVFEFKFEWSDLGNWNALSNLMEIDDKKNKVFGDYFGHNSENNIIYSNKNFIVTSGIKDTIIVEDDDSIYVGHRKNENALKDIDELFKKKPEASKKIFKNKNIVYRPWGFYEDLKSGLTYKVKKIFVNPNSSLSLQSHKFRSEHWVVVDGCATVICGNELFKLNQGESTFIKKNQKHRLINDSKNALIIIEVQYGNKLDENDIIRFNDRYNRI
jgi:mannose-1-phosphate guanylyltransferase/mannose-6-phosphate isomerase